MAFVAVLPTAGTILGGLGAAASAIPVIGGIAAPVLGGLGGAATALGAGNIMGAGSSLLSGVLGGGAGLYKGADMLLGGLLPNLGGGIGITPTDGFLGPKGLGIIGGKGQLLGPAADAISSPSMPAGSGSGMIGPVQPISNQFSDFLNGGAPVTDAGINQGMAQIMPGAGGRPDGFSGIVHDFKQGAGALKDKVDPVLGPITEAGVGLGKAMDTYNKFFGPDEYQTPAQAAQVPVQISQPQFTPMKQQAPQATQVQLAPPTSGLMPAGTPVPMGGGGQQMAAFVPMNIPPVDNEMTEEEIEKFRELLEGQSNFLTGVNTRLA